jgi:hypothetical protein
MKQQDPPLTLDEWRIIATQTIICRAELSKLAGLLSGRIRCREIDELMRINKNLSLLRYRLETMMFDQTSTQDTHIFDPEVQK